MLREVKEFALQGNVLEIGVGLIIGAAFGKVVSSLVNDVPMPPIGLLVAVAIFMLIRQVNKLKRQRPAPTAAPATKECPRCLSTIALRATRCPRCTSERKVA